MFKLHPKDSFTFKVIDTNPAKGTVTLLPTFGSILKMGFTLVGAAYLGSLTRDLVVEARKSTVIEMDPEHDTRSTQ